MSIYSTFKSTTYEDLGFSKNDRGQQQVYQSVLQNDALIFNHNSDVYNKRLIQVFTLVSGGEQNVSNTTLDFDLVDEGNYIQEDSVSGTDFVDGQVILHKETASSKTCALLIRSDTTNGSTTFTDISGNNRTISVPTGSVQHTTAYAALGGSSMVFDPWGTLEVSDYDDFDFGTSPFSIDFYARHNNLPGSPNQTNVYFINAPGLTFYYHHQANNYYVSINGQTISNAGINIDGVWQHIQIVGNGSTIRLYTSGTSRGTVSQGTINVTGPFRIGNASGYEGFHMDEIRIVDGRQSAVGQWLRPSGFNNDPGCVILSDTTNGDGTFTDSTGNCTISKSGSPTHTTAEAKWGGSSMLFDALEYITIDNYEDFNFGSEPFTVDFWVKCTGMPTGGNAADYSFVNAPGFNFYYHHQQNNYYMMFNGTQSNYAIPCDGVWCHVLLRGTGTSLKISLNGGTDRSIAYTPISVTGPIKVGAYNNGYGGIYMDELRITKGANDGVGYPLSRYQGPTTVYQTTQPYYVTTSNSNHLNLGWVNNIDSCTITTTEPANTSIRGLVSFDGRSTWKKWSGSVWATHTGGLANLQTGNTKAEIQTGLTNLDVSELSYLDFAFDLKSTNDAVTPSIDQITVVYDEMGVYELAQLGVDFKYQTINDTQTRIVKLSSGTANSIKVNIIT